LRDIADEQDGDIVFFKGGEYLLKVIGKQAPGARYAEFFVEILY